MFRPLVRAFVILPLMSGAAWAQAPVNADEQPVPYEALVSTVNGIIADLRQRADMVTPPGPPALVPNKAFAPSIASMPGRPFVPPVASNDPHLKIVRRVHAEIQDFYRINLEAVTQSQTNIVDYGLPVTQKDLKKLQSSITALKAYDAATLTPLLTKEDAVVAQEDAVVDKITAIRESQLDVLKKFAPIYKANVGKATPPELQAIETQYRQALNTAGQPLAGLFQQWQALDQQDESLAQTYVRKNFTSEIPDLYRGGNSVTPLVDGATVYPRIDQLLTDVATNGGSHGYVHISLWWCQAETTLAKGRTFAQAIQAVAAAGAEVRITLWNPSLAAATVGGFGNVNANNGACKTTLEKLHGDIKVEMKSHANDTGAFHEKYFVFYNGSQLHAIVGGLNIDGGELSTPNHASPRAPDQWEDVHDVAMEISGPAVADVDADFGAHWYWDHADGNITATPAKFAATGNEDVAIAVTDPLATISINADNAAGTSEPFVQPNHVSPPKLIQNELLQRINAAQNYIYIENYAIFDETIIAALGRKIAAEKIAGHSFPVILLLHNVPGAGSYSFLHFITYQHLSFMGCGSFNYRDAGGVMRHVDRKSQGVHVWRVEPYAGNYYGNTKVQWDGGEIKLTDILSFDNDHPLYALVSLPRGQATPLPAWVHSKVSIFDDEYAGVGSANFNSRSMLDDGELDAFVHGQAAANLRQSLWAEYMGGKAPAPSGFDAAAKADTAAQKTLPPGRLFVMPLHRNDLTNAAIFANWQSNNVLRSHLLGARYE